MIYLWVRRWSIVSSATPIFARLPCLLAPEIQTAEAEGAVVIVVSDDLDDAPCVESKGNGSICFCLSKRC